MIETNKGEKILVSEYDFEHLKQFKWHINNSGYGKSDINNKNWLMHRYIFIEILGHKELTRHNIIDHINGNRSDNRRENLRIVTIAENGRNKNKKLNASSQYFGVCKLEKNFRTTLI